MARLTQIMILYCGQGMTTLVEVYDGGDPKKPADFLALVDCGGNIDAGQAATTYIANKVAAKKDKLLDAVLISHQDSDHVALLPQLAEKMKFLGCTAENMSLGGISWEKVNKTRVTKFAREMDIDEDEIEFNAPYASDYEDVAKRADLGHYISYEDVFIRALVSGLSVTGKADIVKNSSSAIVVVENGSFSTVLPGDATYQTMGAANDILDTKNLIPKVVGLEIPHHGALRTAVEDYYAKGEPGDFDWSIINAFAANLAPKQVVASAGPWNTHRHPVDEVLKVFKATLSPAPDHNYVSFVFAKEPGELTSQGWMNFSKVLNARHCTVQKLSDAGNVFGNISIKLSAPGVLRDDEMVTFQPLGTFGPGGPNDDPIYFAPAP